MKKTWLFALIALMPLGLFAKAKVEKESYGEFDFGDDSYIDPEKRWYFEIKPGYFCFIDQQMREFYDNGGFAFRGEMGYKFWGPLLVWFDGGYFQTDGKAIGGDEDLSIRLASMTLGLKAIYYFTERIAVYGGAGPRLFMMMIHNDSPFVRGDDNEIGIGGGFSGGFWFFPFPQCPNIFFDLFADYSWKNMAVQADEISSFDSDVNISGIIGGLGMGFRF